MTAPTKDDNFVTIKMSTGEVLVGIKRNETPSTVTVEYPFHVKNYPRFVEGGVIETITAGPYCSFTQDRLFELPKKDIVFVKPMHAFAVPFYLNLWQQHETPMRVGKDGKPLNESVHDSEAITAEELKDRIERLIGKMTKLDDVNRDTQSEEFFEDEYEEEEYLERKEKNTLH